MISFARSASTRRRILRRSFVDKGNCRAELVSCIPDDLESGRNVLSSQNIARSCVLNTRAGIKACPHFLLYRMSLDEHGQQKLHLMG